MVRLHPVVRVGCSNGLIARKGGHVSALSSRKRQRHKNFRQDRASLASAASSSEIASMASRGACGSKWTAWTSNRPAWRSAFRSSRATRRSPSRNGEDIISVLALLGRRINLDPVVKVEEPQRRASAPRRADRTAPTALVRRRGAACGRRGEDRRGGPSREPRPAREGPSRPASRSPAARRAGRDGNSRAIPARWQLRALELSAR